MLSPKATVEQTLNVSDLEDTLKLFNNIIDVNLGDLKTDVIQEQDILKKMIKSGVIIEVRNKGNRIMHKFAKKKRNLYTIFWYGQIASGHVWRSRCFYIPT
jgi:hypothetical protein